MHVLSVSTFKLRLSVSPKLSKYLSTIFMSHVSTYFGREGLLSKTPLTSLHTSGWLPTVMPLTVGR